VAPGDAPGPVPERRLVRAAATAQARSVVDRGAPAVRSGSRAAQRQTGNRVRDGAATRDCRGTPGHARRPLASDPCRQAGGGEIAVAGRLPARCRHLRRHAPPTGPSGCAPDSSAGRHAHRDGPVHRSRPASRGAAPGRHPDKGVRNLVDRAAGRRGDARRGARVCGTASAGTSAPQVSSFSAPTSHRIRLAGT